MSRKPSRAPQNPEQEGRPAPYDPRSVEPRHYQEWLARGYFHAPVDPSRRPYTIMMPLPNITGTLHMGHALNQTVQDLLTRWRRMQGYNAMWLPGTDHAGIAAQVVMERELAKEGKTRFDMGRERFLEFAWQWRERYGDLIYSQIRRMGSGCDWDRVTFTMDPAYYDEPQDPRTGVSVSSKLRDALEIPLVREALKRDMPVLAICRGMQVLNVAAGGSLHQHVEGHAESDQGESACHPVTFEKDSRLARLLGLDGAAIINSRHHQAVDRVASGFVVVATSPDGVVEAMESPKYRWAFGIQCHPERADEVPAEMQRLFVELVKAATLRELVQQVRTQNQQGEAHG